MENYKRILLKYTDKEYNRVMVREERTKTTLQYFKQFNRWEIVPRCLNEDKMFNAGDLYYINKIREI